MNAGRAFSEAYTVQEDSMLTGLLATAQQEAEQAAAGIDELLERSNESDFRNMY